MDTQTNGTVQRAHKYSFMSLVNWFSTRVPGTHNGERIVSSKMVLEKLDSHKQKNETGFLFTLYTKINSKCIRDLNIRPEIIKKTKDKCGKDVEKMEPPYTVGGDVKSVLSLQKTVRKIQQSHFCVHIQRT